MRADVDSPSGSYCAVNLQIHGHHSIDAEVHRLLSTHAFILSSLKTQFQRVLGKIAHLVMSIVVLKIFSYSQIFTSYSTKIPI